MRKTFLFLALALLPMFGRADDSVTKNGFNFLLHTDFNNQPLDATLDGYTGYLSGDVGLPGSIFGYPVTAIWVYAFQNKTALTGVTIPGGVVFIGDNAFAGCTSMKSVSIPNSVTYIFDGVFQHCHSLLNVALPDSVTSIAPYTFFDCSSLTGISIGHGVTSIGYQAFQLCTSLKSLTIPDNVTSIQSDGFHGCTNLSNVTIGNGLTFIGPNAFYDCSSLTNIMFGNSVNSIGADAFYDCSNLTRITIPASVTTIMDQAFYHCTRLTNITFLGNAPTLGSNVFDGLPTNAIAFYHYGMSGWGKTYGGVRTRALGVPFSWLTNNLGSLSNAVNITITGYTGGFTSVAVPDDINGYPVTGIANQAFINANMTNVVVPNSITTIGDGAFAGCTNLTGLTFLGNAPAFGTGVFDGVPATTTINYLNGATGWNNSYDGLFTGSLSTTSDGFGFALNEDNTVAITGYSGSGGNLVIPDSIYGATVSAIHDSVFEGTAVASMTIPDSVTSIGSYAFGFCYGLTNVTIGSGITNIGDYAFYYCSGLTNIMFRGDAPALGTGVFWNDGFGATVYYRPGASGWDTTFGGLPASMIVATTPDGFEYATYPDHAEILSYNGPGGAITIPDTIDDHPVSVVDDPCDAFMTSLTIPASVISIRDNSFNGWNNLTNITFLGNAPTLGTNVFNGLAPGATVYYHSGTTGWGTTYGGLPAKELDRPFIYDVNPDNTLTLAGLATNDFSLGLNIPGFVYGLQSQQSVTSIGAGAFSNITNLIQVVIPTNITNIGDGAFSGCINLTNITFLGNAPASGTGVFANVGSGATVFYLPGTSGWDTTFDGLPAVMITTTPDGFGFALNEDSTVTITNYTGDGGAVTVPDSIYGHPVSIIDDPQDGVGVTSVTIPDSVTNIRDNSFNGWSDLTNITFLGNAPMLGTNVFNGIASGATIYYYYGTSGWDVTFGGLPAIELNPPAIAATFSVPALINNQFQFTVNGTGGSNYVVQATTNLADWISLTTNAAPFQFTETNAHTFDQRFYRVKIWP